MAKEGWWEEGGPLFKWWKELQGLQGDALDVLKPVEPRPGMRGERAELKRAGTAGEVVCGATAYHRLRRLMPVGSSADEARLIAVVRVLAHVEGPVRAEDGGLEDSFARLLATPKSEGRSAASELRFKRLLRIDADWEQLTDAIVRLLALVDHKAHPLNLAKDIWWWNERTRRRWANDYYQKLLESNS